MEEVELGGIKFGHRLIEVENQQEIANAYAEAMVQEDFLERPHSIIMSLEIFKKSLERLRGHSEDEKLAFISSLVDNGMPPEFQGMMMYMAGLVFDYECASKVEEVIDEYGHPSHSVMVLVVFGHIADSLYEKNGIWLVPGDITGEKLQLMARGGLSDFLAWRVLLSAAAEYDGAQAVARLHPDE
ncbi:MAG: hypothetical protein HQL69_17040 [Magnetococcales bacterium]|nr:hypothetical protein [Magnetococcales bacterium]